MYFSKILKILKTYLHYNYPIQGQFFRFVYGSKIANDWIPTSGKRLHCLINSYHILNLNKKKYTFEQLLQTFMQTNINNMYN